jgi:poly(A) polymerase
MTTPTRRPDDPRPPADRRGFATDVVRRLREAGFRAYWAGGCVRDLILGGAPADYDVATEAPPEDVMRLFRRTVPVGVSFGVVRVLGPRGAGEVEVATFRSDGRYVDGRRPESVTFGSPEEDASRRDFTINGMFLDPISGEILDLVGGRADLEAGVVRAIGDPAARFAEDKLRLLRAVRFAARFGFRLDPATRAALVAMAEQIHVVAAERISQELRRMLVHPSRRRGMELVAETGLLDAILPEVAGLKGRSDGDVPDLWAHTLDVLDHLPAEPAFPLALAALLHEVGKPLAASNPGDLALVPEHARVAKRRADDLARDLKLSNAEREDAAWLVEHHVALRSFDAMPVSRKKRLLARPGIGDLLALHRADALAHSGIAPHVEACEAYLAALPDGPLDPPPLLTGDDLRRHGLTPGPQFKGWLDAVRDAQLENRVTTRDEAFALLDRLVVVGGGPASG